MLLRSPRGQVPLFTLAVLVISMEIVQAIPTIPPDEDNMLFWEAPEEGAIVALNDTFEIRFRFGKKFLEFPSYDLRLFINNPRFTSKMDTGGHLIVEFGNTNPGEFLSLCSRISYSCQ